MCPCTSRRNVKLLDANNFQQVTSTPFGYFPRESTGFFIQCAKSFFFICWHHLFMLSHMTYSGVLAGADTQGMLCGHRTLMLRKATSLCYSSIAADAAVWRKGGEKTPTEDLQNWFVLFFGHCKRSMRHKSERKMAFTAMKVYKHPPTASASVHISWHYKV